MWRFDLYQMDALKVLQATHSVNIEQGCALNFECKSVSYGQGGSI